MRYPHFSGTAQRLRRALVEAGYVDEAGGPDVPRFIREKHYDPRVFYPWVNVEKPRTPSGSYLSRLCGDLGIKIEWLLLGVRAGVVAFIIASLSVGISGGRTRDTGPAASDSTHYVMLRRPRSLLLHHRWGRHVGGILFRTEQLSRLVKAWRAFVSCLHGGDPDARVVALVDGPRRVAHGGLLRRPETPAWAAAWDVHRVLYGSATAP